MAPRSAVRGHARASSVRRLDPSLPQPDDWTFDPTDEAKRAAAIAAFQKRLEGKLDDDADDGD